MILELDAYLEYFNNLHIINIIFFNLWLVA